MSRTAAAALARLALGSVVLLLPALAGATLRVEAEVTPGNPPLLHVTATNSGDRAAERVTPEVAFQHRLIRGDTLPLAPGARHVWALALPTPTDPGTFAAIVRVEYDEPGAGGHLVPLVALVPTPGAEPGAVRTSLGTEPAGSYTRARLLIDNPGGRPIAGRVVMVLPGELHTEPESQAVQVTAKGQRIVPLALEGRGARPGVEYPAFALLEYTSDGMHYAVLARTDTTVPAGTSGRTLPLAIGGLALAVTLGLLVIAWRQAARR